MDTRSSRGRSGARLAKNVSRFPPSLGLFDRFVLEKKGEDRGKLNLKKGGIFTITEGVSLLAMEAGVYHGTTWDKLEELIKLEVMGDEEGEEIMLAFNFLMWLRLRTQINLIKLEKPLSDFVNPSTLRPIEQTRLRESLKSVRKLLRMQS